MPWDLLLVALPFLVIVSGQTFHTGYPFSTETSWTRYTWPDLKVRFPYERLIDWDQADLAALHSSTGPQKLAQYKAEAREHSHRPFQYASSQASEESILRCTTCSVLMTTVWEVAREKLHRTGLPPNDQQLMETLHRSCEEQTPDIMQTLGKLSQKLHLLKGGTAQLSDESSAAKVKESCKAVLEIPVEGEQKTAFTAVGQGMRMYASRVNAMVGLKRGGMMKSFERQPEPDVCEDFHSECRNWAVIGECHRNPGYMIGNGKDDLPHCSASCGSCLARLTSGDLPLSASHVGLSTEILHQVQFTACNASGVCAGVDASLLPKITTISLEPGDAESPNNLQGFAPDNQAHPLSPDARPKSDSEVLQDLAAAAAMLPPSECFQINADWWTYELCPGMHIHQFHVDAKSGAIQQTISLGFYNREIQPVQTEAQVLDGPLLAGKGHGPSKFYVKSLYNEGSKCYLPSKGVEVAREAEVRMACSMDGRTYLTVNEPSMCKYAILLRTPSLCPQYARQPAFRKPPLNKEEL